MERIEVKDLTISRNNKIICDAISFVIEANSAVGFMGANGSGKTTLLRTLLGVIEPDKGAILVDGTVVPCCLDSNGIIDLGNIYKESIEEIQNKERYQKLKKSFQDRKPEEKLCQSCTFKERK